MLLREFARAGVGVETVHERVQNAIRLTEALAQRSWDCVICDYSMPGFDAYAALAILQQSGKDLPFIVVSGSIPEHDAIDLMKRGAYDYLLKDKLARLVPATQREINEAENREHHRQAEIAHQQREEQLRQTQKMEAIDRLSGGVAHDFNNLLTVILGNTQLIESLELHEPELSESLEEIKEAAERASTLTRQLLTFSRKQPLLEQQLDLHEVVANTTRMLRRILGEDIEIELRVAASPARIAADLTMLEQVLLNFAVNARDAMPAGGRFTITICSTLLGKIEPPAPPHAPPGPYIKLSFHDTGVGITADNLPRIFEPCFSTKDVGQGTGLGLATVYSIMEQHKRWLQVTSDQDASTEFIAFFPACPDNVSSAIARHSSRRQAFRLPCGLPHRG
ncbi:MAG: response regulator [Candidatus Synoicihabitans palmerolidicus]|nr:response regulator [Candidatus Synoicihabitans palmerolidicus]